jgi:signal transduction histidine kinase
LVDLSSPTLSARNDAPTAGRAIFSRGVKPGFRSLAVAAGLVLVAIFFLFQALFHQKVLIEQRSRANIWFLAQAEIEYLNFTTALDLYALHDDQITKDALLDRFEIFWSRLPVLLTGKPTEQLRHVEGLVDTISKLIARMEVLEPALSRLDRDDPRALEDFRHQIAMLHPPLREMVGKALAFDNATLTAERRSHETIYDQLLALFVAVLAAGVVVFFLLQRQILRTQSLVLHARGAEKAADTARAELVLAIESISEGFVIHDQEDRVALFNERYRDLYPVVAEFIAVGARFEDLLRVAVARDAAIFPAGEVEPMIAQRLHDHRMAGGVFESQANNDRHIKISERKTADGRIVGVHTDVTELKEREIQLTQKTALLQATFDSIDQGIALFDAERRLQTSNRLFATLNDLPPDLVAPGRLYGEIVAYDAERGEYGEGSAAEHVERQQRILGNLHGPRGGQRVVERQRANGTAIETRYLVLADGSFVKIHSDITDRVRAEEERSRLREQFHASQKMQAVGTLAGGIAHDFNNILASMLGNCFLLLEDLPEKNAVHERLEEIMRASRRAKALVQQILTYSRHAEFTLVPLRADEVIRDSLARLRPSLPPTVDLVGDGFAAAMVAADAAQLHQVMLNLCTNATQAIGDRPGTISVAMTTLDPTRADGAAGFSGQAERAATTVAGRMKIWIGTLGPRAYCRVRIADTGSGMDRQTMTRIFEPFFTTKGVGGGTGLGLAAVHGILRNHNAVIAVSSAPGDGTVFEIYLPLCEAA